MDKYISTPVTEEVTSKLQAGDYVYISGTVYVARDAAHHRFMEALKRVEEGTSEEERMTQEYKKKAADSSDRKFHDILYGSFSGQRRASHRFCWANYRKPHG